MQGSRKTETRPRLVLAFYLITVLLAAILVCATTRHVVPVDEPLDVLELIVASLLLALLVYVFLGARSAVRHG